MKKFIVFICLLILTVSVFYGCSKEEEKDPVLKQVCFYHNNLYCGQNDIFSISLECGMKEKENIIDGKVNNLIDFTKLKVIPLNIDYFGKDYSFIISGKDGKISGTLEKDVFGTTYLKDVNNISSIGAIQDITIKSNNIESKITLNDKINDMLKWKDVLNIAKENYNDAITTELNENSFNREIYIKFINDNKNIDSPYYWYVALIASKNDYWAMLIDPKSGTIITKKS
jgi:hypothetical protein